MIVYVEDVESFNPQGTVTRAVGTTEDGSVVIFAGDWRPMRDLQAYVEEEGGVDVEVEDWAVLSVTSPDPDTNDDATIYGGRG
jgi:hypothetical protein